MALGMFFAFLAALGWGSGAVFARRAMAYAPASIVLFVALAFILLIVGGLGLLTLGTRAYVDVDPTFFAWVALLAVFNYLLGEFAHFLAMHKASVTIVAPIIGAAPLFALALAVTLGNERPSVVTVISAFIIVAGVAIILSDRGKVLR